MRIFHVAAADEWEAAQGAGAYAQSTLGVPLRPGHYIHAAYEPQVETVRRRYYAEVYTPLLLLEIDTARLHSPVIHEQPYPGSEEIYPHIYGPVNVDAVVGVSDITRSADDGPEGAIPVVTVDP